MFQRPVLLSTSSAACDEGRSGDIEAFHLPSIESVACAASMKRVLAFPRATIYV